MTSFDVEALEGAQAVALAERAVALQQHHLPVTDRVGYARRYRVHPGLLRADHGGSNGEREQSDKMDHTGPGVCWREGVGVAVA